MKAKDLIQALSKLDPEANVVINIKQHNKVYGKQVDINYGTKTETGNKEYDEHSYLCCWVNNSYRGSITVHLPEKAIISNWPKDLI